MMSPGVYVVEHKSTSLDIGEGSPYWKRLILDGQISNYNTGTRALGHEPVGVLYDVIRKPTLRPLKATPLEERKYTQEKSRACKECKKKAPTPGPHVETIENDDGTPREVSCVDGRIVTDPGGQLYKNMREHDETPDEFAARIRADIAENPDRYYQRGTIVRLAREEQEAAKNVWEIARQIRESQLANRWPQNPDACDAYGSFCPYFSVCADGASIDDPTRFRDADEHEELDGAKNGAKVRLPLVTTSSMKTYRSCQRKYFFMYERRRRSLAESAALRFGTLIHKALERWWLTVSLDEAFAAMAGESDPFELAKARELMRGYHARWMHEPLTVLAVESEFAAPLVNPETGKPSQTWELGGKIDALVRVGDAASAAA